MFRIQSPARLGCLVAPAVAMLAAAAHAQTPAATPPAAQPSTLNSSSQSRVVISIQPVGKVAYDGLVIPIISPDGRFIATQSGRAPAWDVVLADKTAKPPMGLTLSAYRIPIDPEPVQPVEGKGDDAKPKPPSISLIRWPKPFIQNVVLGRAADDRGFLIEAPQSSGSRWIGRASWLSGDVEWLVRDTGKGVPIVNAHAALANDGALVYVRREIDATAFQLVVRTRKGEAWTELVHSALDASESFCFPFFSADGSVVAAFAVPTADMAAGPVSLVAFARPDPEAGHGLSLVEIGRLDVGRGGVTAAYQAASTIQSPTTLPKPAENELVATTSTRSLFASGVSVFSLRDGTTVWWDPRRSQVVPFGPRAAIAVLFQHSGIGMLLSGDKDLMYQPLRAPTDREPELLAGRSVSVMAGRAIPRSTTRQTANGGVIVALTPPGMGEENAFRVILISPAKPE